jgi:hypothetical protein
LLEAAFWGDATTVKRFLAAFRIAEARSALTGAALPFSAPTAFDEAMRIALVEEPIVYLVRLSIPVRSVVARCRGRLAAFDAMKQDRAAVVELLSPFCVRHCTMKALDQLAWRACRRGFRAVASRLQAAYDEKVAAAEARARLPVR